jgi:pimeloyl-ACP methyl ester carboxylesterase
VQPVIVDELKLEYDDRSSGEPIVFIHGSVLADAFEPLLSEPELSGRYRLISYHRRGFAGSTHPNHPISMAEQAEDCRKLLRHLGVARAHVVGYSYGGLIALQLALDTPELVESLVLLEPPLLDVPSGAGFSNAMASVLQQYESGNKSGAIDAFLRLVSGKAYRRWLDRTLPEAFSQAVSDADTLFLQEWPALLGWSFGVAEARSFTHPVLAVLGADSAEVTMIFGEGRQKLREWLPLAERRALPRDARRADAESTGHGRGFGRLPCPAPAQRIFADRLDSRRNASSASLNGAPVLCGS